MPLRQKRGWTVLALTIAVAGGAGAATLGKTFTLSDEIASALSRTGLISGTYPIRINLDRASRAETAAHETPLEEAETGTSSPAAADAEPITDDNSPSPAPDAPISRSGERFARAFSDLGQSLDPRPPDTADTAKLIALNYSIANPGAHGNSIEIRKAVQADGVGKGKVSLRIVNDTTIMVNSRDIESLFGNSISEKLATSLRASPKADGYIDFDVLRAAGINIRYDAARDVVVMSSRTS